jgi:hypothetical protein
MLFSGGVLRKRITKRAGDALEKMGIGSMLVGLFQGQDAGVVIGITCLAVSFLLTALEDI